MYELHHISELQHRLAAFDDQHAYRELFNRFQPMLKRFAYSITHDMESAEEAVSDVFIRVWQKRKTLDHIHNLKLYLYIATRNFSLNQVRAQRRLQNLQIEEMNIDIEEVALNPAEALDLSDLQRLISEAVAQLPTQCRLIYKLVKEDGLRQKEVAELLHLQPKTVENQIAIAVRKIGQVIIARQRIAQSERR